MLMASDVRMPAFIGGSIGEATVDRPCLESFILLSCGSSGYLATGKYHKN